MSGDHEENSQQSLLQSSEDTTTEPHSKRPDTALPTIAVHTDEMTPTLNEESLLELLSDPSFHYKLHPKRYIKEAVWIMKRFFCSILIWIIIATVLCFIIAELVQYDIELENNGNRRRHGHHLLLQNTNAPAVTNGNNNTLGDGGGAGPHDYETPTEDTPNLSDYAALYLVRFLSFAMTQLIAWVAASGIVQLIFAILRGKTFYSFSEIKLMWEGSMDNVWLVTQTVCVYHLCLLVPNVPFLLLAKFVHAIFFLPVAFIIIFLAVLFIFSIPVLVDNPDLGPVGVLKNSAKIVRLAWLSWLGLFGISVLILTGAAMACFFPLFPAMMLVWIVWVCAYADIVQLRGRTELLAGRNSYTR